MQSNDLPVGRIAGLFGIRGELKCDPTTSGRSLFQPDASFRVNFTDGSSEDVRVRSVREHQGRLLLRIEHVVSADDAQRYVGATFYAAQDRILLEPGEYLDRDLVGCELVDERGNALGTVSALEHYPGSDMLVVNGRLVPLVQAFIRSIDTGAKRIVVELPPGLLDDDYA